jgi:acyl carrier protein
MRYELRKAAVFLFGIWELFTVLDRSDLNRNSDLADRIAALVQAILAKRAITRAVGRDDALSDCGISSLDMVNLMLAVEGEFDLKIPDREMTPANFRTIAQIEALVGRLRTAG